MTTFSAYFVFLRFGLLCVGGGNALVPLYIDELVQGRGWMTLEEFGNLTAIAQFSPGPIGINTATFIGYRSFGGTVGAAFATLGLITPSVLIMSFVAKHIESIERSRFFGKLLRGVAPATIALMFVAAWIFAGMSAFEGEIFNGGTIRPFAVVICAAAAYAVSSSKAKITTVIFASAAFGAIVHGFAA